MLHGLPGGRVGEAHIETTHLKFTFHFLLLVSIRYALDQRVTQLFIAIPSGVTNSGLPGSTVSTPVNSSITLSIPG